MGNLPFRQKFLLALVLLVCLFPASLRAQPPPLPVAPSSETGSDAYNLAIQALNREDYPTALSEIQQAIADNPENLEYQYVLGRCYLRMQRLDEAEGIFLALIHQDEHRFGKAYFDEASVLVQRGKEEEALKVIEKGRPTDPGRADYETGIVYMRLKKFSDAVEPLRRASAKKPELAPQAMTQQAIAEFHLKHFKESKSLLEQVLKMDLPPKKAEEIRRMLKTVDAALVAARPWELTAAAGIQYDDNVFQTPLQRANFQRTRLTDDDEDDVGFITSLRGKYRVWEQGPWNMGVGYDHYSIVYVDHTQLDAVGARPSVFFQWDKAPYTAELDYAYSHFWVGGDSWLNVQSILPRFSMQHGEKWRTNVIGGTEWHLYEDSTPNDTWYFLGAYEMYLLKEGKGNLRAGFLLGYDNLSPNDRADFGDYEITVGFQYPVWRDKWFVDLSGRYIWRDFEHDPSFSETKDRFDQEKDLSLILYGYLTQRLLLSFQFQQIWNDSNVPNPPDSDLFSYTRATYTWMLTYNF